MNHAAAIPFTPRFVTGPMWLLPIFAQAVFAEPPQPPLPDIPDTEITAAYQRAAVQNVLAAVNPKVFPGYWSVFADGQGFGYGNTYPSLDGHQMTAALLWLGQIEVVKANWDYVRSFQRPDGHLPLAILPALAGKPIGAGKPWRPWPPTVDSTSTGCREIRWPPWPAPPISRTRT